MSVTVSISNTGDHDGAEVVQLYVRPDEMDAAVDRPEKELRCFARLHLEPGETARAEMKVTPRDLAYFDVRRQSWVAPAGRYELVLAASAVDIRERVAITLKAEWSEPA